jgi:hypothetical protein
MMLAAAERDNPRLPEFAERAFNSDFRRFAGGRV